MASADLARTKDWAVVGFGGEAVDELMIDSGLNLSVTARALAAGATNRS